MLPPQVRGDAAVYGLFEQTLWRLPGSPNRALGFFARGAVAPSDRSEFDRYVDAGFTFRGPLARRPEDIFGIAFAYGPGLLTVSHGPNEFVPIRNISQCAAIYALTAAEMLR